MVLWFICVILGTSIFLMRYCPDTPMARALHRHLAVEPVRWLSERRRSDLFYVLILGGFGVAGGEVFAVLGPEAVLMFSADLAVYLDLVVFSSLAAVGARLRGTWQATLRHALAIRVRAFRMPGRHGRQVSRHRIGRVLDSDNDDDDSCAGGLLAA